MATQGGHLEHNPYVGPRPIQQGEPIYGRDAEVEALYCELQARRIVVLHSPSGAGKSSLTQAGLIPKLEAGGFAVWRPIRVNLDLTTAKGVPEGTNRYLLSALSSLEDELPRDKQRSLSELAELDFSTYLQTRPRRKKQVGRPLVLLFDQFEEVLTVAPQAVEAKRAFFSEMGQALEQENTWALLIIREDFLAAFAPYRDRLPTHMTNTFRLDLLGVAGAREAALRPAESAGREFPAVDQLVRDLSITKVQQADGSVVVEPGIYVEPVQLQVVCRRLWASMPEDAPSIEHEHIAEYASVSESLAAYYAQAMAEVSGGDVAIERTIREWVGETLIVGGIRSQVRLAAGGAGREKDETTAALDRARIQGLLDTYLIRVEPRAGVDWYELSHDRLVEPVQQDNERWAQDNLHPVQVQAKLWVGGRRAPGLLLSEAALPEAITWAQDNDTRLTEDERDFLRRSQDVREAERRERCSARTWRWTGVSLLGLMVVGSIVVMSIVLSTTSEIDARSVELTGQKELFTAQRVKLVEQEQALKTRLAAQQGQQASRLAKEKGRELDAVRKAMGAVELLVPEGRAGDVRDNHVASERMGWLEIEAAMPFEVFKGLTDSLGRVREGIAVWGHVTDTKLSHYSSEVLAVTYSPDGSQFITASYDETARLWDAYSGVAIHILQGHTSPVVAVAYSPDGRQVATASHDETVRIWDVATGREIMKLKHVGPVQDVAYSSDGDRLATASGSIVWVWYLDADAMVVPLLGHEDQVESVAFLPSGPQLATASRDQTVRLWNTDMNTLMRTLIGHEDSVVDVAVSLDGTRLATASRDKTARLWDPTTGEQLARFAYGEVMQAVAFSPDGERVATASFDDDAGHLWDIASGRRLTSFQHQGPVTDIAFSPDGAQLATTSWDKTARSWDLDPGPAVMTLQGHRSRVDSVAVSSDGTRIVTASGDQTARVWDANTGVPLTVLRGHTIDVLSVAISPDDTRIATSSWDGVVRLWDARTGAQSRTLKGHQGSVVAVVFSPDGTQMATASTDRTARIWDLASGQVLSTLEHQDRVDAVVFSPDGSRVVTVSRAYPPRVWDAATGEALTGFFYDEPATAMAYSPDGQRLAVASLDHSVQILEVKSATLLGRLEGHTTPVRVLAFSPDGKRLASASEEGTVRIWASGREGGAVSIGEQKMAPQRTSDSFSALLSLWHGSPVTSLAFVGDGMRLATASGTKVAKIWSLNPRDWVMWGCMMLDARSGTESAYTAKPIRRACATMPNERRGFEWPALAATTSNNAVIVDTDLAAGEGSDHAPNKTDEAFDAAALPETITVHGVELVLIPGGTFTMGSPKYEVTLSNFYLARTEVTNAQYAMYLKANPGVPKPTSWGNLRYSNPDQPALGINWYEAKAYCDWAGLVLPTEVQWEYAARGGATTAYWFGGEPSDLSRFDWVQGNSGNRPHSVGNKAANAFGIYDIHGNASEWCLDNVGPYTTRPRVGDGLRYPPQGETNRIIRGGYWVATESQSKARYRHVIHGAGVRLIFGGFRPAKNIP